MALFSYLQQTQRLVKDTDQKRYAPNDLIAYINMGRRKVAELSQSVRSLTPISGSITNLTIISGGANYSSPTLTISAPDLPGGMASNPQGLQATATAVLTSGTITGVSITQVGSGYYAPIVSINGATGSGASITATTSSVTTLVQGQEVYSFSTFPIDTPGVGSILAVKSVAIIYNNLRYALPMYSFSTYQAKVRNYPYQYNYVPTVSSQYGQGVGGSIYFYPIPSQSYSFQCDCICLPIDLVSDDDIEAIPLPWTDSVPYYAAYLAKLEGQDMNGAQAMLGIFEKMMGIESTSARPGRVSNPYGRW